MLLFHVSSLVMQTAKRPKRFYPRVPIIKGSNENNSIGRICFSSDIKKCLLAMPCGEDSAFDKNEVQKRTGIPSLFDVYVLDTETVSRENILTPGKLHNLSYVNDALENDEYWVINTDLKLYINKTIRVKQILQDKVEERGVSFEDFVIEEAIEQFSRAETYIFVKEKHLKLFEELLLKENITILDKQIVNGYFVITFQAMEGVNMTKLWKFYYFISENYSSSEFWKVVDVYNTITAQIKIK